MLRSTLGALKQHILRVHIEASVWGHASIAQQEFLDPLQNGFCKDANGDLMIYQHQRPSSRWLIATVMESARHKGADVDHTP